MAKFSQISYEGVPQNGILQHRFEVRNEGTDVLELREITPSCGCTLISVGHTTIPLGGTSFIEAKMEPSPLRRVSFISVVTNDPSRPEITLELRAIGLYPNEFSFLPSSRRITVKAGDPVVVNVMLRFISRKENGPLKSELGKPEFICECEGIVVDCQVAPDEHQWRDYVFATTFATNEHGWIRIEHADRTVWLFPVILKIFSDQPGPKIGMISAKLKGNHIPDQAFLLLGVDVE
jgi:hypothetical protein